MTAERESPLTLARLSSILGLTSDAAVGLYSPAQIMRRVEETGPPCDWSIVRKLHAEAKKLHDDLRVLEKSVLTRASPLLPRAIRASIKQSDVSLLDYQGWFGERAAQYARPGEVASMFSPAAYLAVLYREASTLYKADSVWHIDRRRPDLKDLPLTQANMDTEVAALALSNELLMALVQDATDFTEQAVLKTLATHVQTAGTPYHHYHARLRLIQQLKDPAFLQMRSAPLVTGHLSGQALAGLQYDIPPALYRLLTDEITEENAPEKYATYFGEISPEVLMAPQMLRRWYGLADEEVALFIGASPGEYVDDVLTARMGGVVYRMRVTKEEGPDQILYLRFYPLGNDAWKMSVNFKNVGYSHHLFILSKFNTVVPNVTINAKDVDDEKFIVGKEYSTVFTYSGTPELPSQFSVETRQGQDDSTGYFYFTHRVDLEVLDQSSYVLRLNKLIRLYKATGLSPQVLEDIVNAVNPDQITDETLSLIFLAAQLVKHDGVPHEDALVMMGGSISLSSRRDERSHWDRTFNRVTFAEGGFTPAPDVKVKLNPDRHEEKYTAVRAALRSACEVDDDGLYWLGRSLAEDERENVTIRLSHKQVSQLYALSLWARSLQLTPQSLHRLLAMLGAPGNLHTKPPAVWQALWQSVSATVAWLDTQGWTVHDLVLMTRDVSEQVASTEITEFLKQAVQVIASVSEGAADSEPSRLAQLAPLVDATFALNSGTATHVLLRWTGAGSGISFSAFWDALQNAVPEEAFTASTVKFAYGLAQRALIFHATQTPPDALALFTDHPEKISPALTSPLACSLPVIRALADFSQWLKTRPDAAGEVLDALAGAGLTPVQAARTHDVSVSLAAQAMEIIKPQEGPQEDLYLCDAAQIQVLQQWLELARFFGVSPLTVQEMLALGADYQAPQASVSVDDDATWEAWKKVADAFAAGLMPEQQRVVEERLAAGLSGALSGYYLDTEAAARALVTDREKLQQYLLSDNLNGATVRTSRLADAQAALQTFIHQALTETDYVADLNDASLSRQFFLDWNRWNARYSTWVASQTLMYYPENFIDPTVRLGQTRMMDDMLDTLGQAQINTDTIGDAFLGYLNGFEEVANLETVNGYHDNLAPDAGKTWFVGRSEVEPRTWWYRTVDEGKRDADSRKLPANAWTGWRQINASLSVVGDLIRPVVHKSRLYMVWMERRDIAVRPGDSEGGQETAPVWQWQLMVAKKRYDESWASPMMIELPLNDTRPANGNGYDKWPAALEDLGLYVSAWPKMETIFVMFYRRDMSFDQTEEVKGILGYRIYADMRREKIEPDDMTQQLVILEQQLEVNGTHPVINQFSSRQVNAGRFELVSAAVPNRFINKVFRVEPKVINEEAGDAYEVQLDITLTADYEAPPNLTVMLALLVLKYPELQEYAGEVDLVINALGVCVVRTPSLSSDAATYTYYTIAGPLFYLSAFNASLMSVVEKEPGSAYGDDNGIVMRWTVAGVRYLHSKSEGPKTSAALATMKIWFWLNRWVEYYHEVNVGMHVSYSGRLSDFHYVQDGIIKKDTIQVRMEGATLTPDADWDTSQPLYVEKTLPVPGLKVSDWGRELEHYHTVTLDINGEVDEYTLHVYKSSDDTPVATLHGDIGLAQYMQFEGNNTRLNTLFARELTDRAETGIDTILSYTTQLIQEPPVQGADTQMDFAGANAIYFWELFYYTPMLVMQRFLQEERFDLAEQWLQYVFNPAGYLDQGRRTDRIWNVRPLLEDTAWNDEPLASYDPDAVAQNDPMHYKLNAFMRLLDITIGKGDAAYRQLERDTLTQAKVWYGRALELLGEAPWVDSHAYWPDPTLAMAASVGRQLAHFEALSQMSKGISRAVDESPAGELSETLFVPEANELMLGYWEKLRIRLYNLRHSLTLDGRPLYLPLFAAPADPKALLAAAVAAESGAGDTLPSALTYIPALRFTPLLESARSMAAQLIQFGSSMQQILLNQDAEALAELLTTQGAAVAASSIGLQKQTLAELSAERVTLTASLEPITMRRDHYQALYDENINGRELTALKAISSSVNLATGAKSAFTSGAAIAAAPNIFGLANGGHQPGQIANAVGYGIEIGAERKMAEGNRITTEELYRRRREDWDLQRKAAQAEIDTVHTQLEALAVRETSAQMQINHMETLSAHAQAQLALFHDKFTGKAMYSWLRGRLATIFYQYYDLTASMCLMAQQALQWEKGDTATYLKTGTWTGAWAGLMSGEGLMLSLAQMEVAWTKHQKRELEVTRSVSLAQVYAQLNPGASLQEAVRSLLAANNSSFDEGHLRLNLENDQLAVTFDLNELKLMADFPNGQGRVRSISVTLPALLGPYQSVRGHMYTFVQGLPVGCDSCAISHALNDNGLFPADGHGDPRASARWLPFEGLDLSKESLMTLSFADATGDQKALLESLTDVILHIQYTVR